MGRLLTGVSIVLFLIVINLLLAFIQTGSTTAQGFSSGCSSSQNATACSADAADRADFFAALRSVTVQAQPFGADAPAIFNVVFFVVSITMLTTAILLIVSSFIPLLSE